MSILISFGIMATTKVVGFGLLAVASKYGKNNKVKTVCKFSDARSALK